MPQAARIQALSVGHALDADSAGFGIVHSVFAHAVNLLIREEMWTLLTSDKADLPFGIRVASADFDVFGFRNGDGNGSHYLFFSGSGSDLAYLSVFWGALVFYRKNNCHRALCWRLGHYDQLDPLTGITHKLCWRHHPAVKQRALKLHHIEAIHGRYLEHRRRRAS